ncbi:unnamed protein product [Durusdinium trenchii]|uniref:Pseudouridine synthase RsuA/RluA-like domain-containing protein n=1 Tax=Durusdinium trenchii TaxID=1381693 RepID=A0ABP0J443_9DINO
MKLIFQLVQLSHMSGLAGSSCGCWVRCADVIRRLGMSRQPLRCKTVHGHILTGLIDLGHSCLSGFFWDFDAQDRGTSGLILCAKTYLGFYLSQLEFEARRLRKTYLCICEGHAPTPPFLLEAPLATRGGRAFVSTRGKHAQTEVVEVSHLLDEVGQPCSLLEVRLHTGRLHQIRAHLSSIGHAIRGDASYGGTKGPRVLLHASRLQIDLRGLGSSIDVTAALPEDFSAALEAMVPCSQKCASIVKQQSRADSRAMQSGVKDGSFTCVTSVTRCFTFKLSGCGLCRALALTAFCS